MDKQSEMYMPVNVSVERLTLRGLNLCHVPWSCKDHRTSQRGIMYCVLLCPIARVFQETCKIIFSCTLSREINKIHESAIDWQSWQCNPASAFHINSDDTFLMEYSWSVKSRCRERLSSSSKCGSRWKNIATGLV